MHSSVLAREGEDLAVWRSARAAESARLESVCGATHRGFESHLLRVSQPHPPQGAPSSDDVLMSLAIAEARLALAHGDVPVGALVVVDGEVISSRHNERELTGDPTAHAEILALRDAAGRLGRWRLDDATLIVTLEPCTMCAGAVINARVARVVFGALDPKGGAMGSLYNVGVDARLNHEVAITPHIQSPQCAALLTSFFADRRADAD